MQFRFRDVPVVMSCLIALFCSGPALAAEPQPAPIEVKDSGSQGRKVSDEALEKAIFRKNFVSIEHFDNFAALYELAFQRARTFEQVLKIVDTLSGLEFSAGPETRFIFESRFVDDLSDAI